MWVQEDQNSGKDVIMIYDYAAVHRASDVAKTEFHAK